MKPYKTRKYIIFTLSIIISLTSFLSFAGEDDFSQPKTLIKIDSAGLETRVLATGFGRPPDTYNVSSAQAKLLARRAAIVSAYKKLLSTMDNMSFDFFPKGRYLLESGFIQGAVLLETRYYGDGSVEVDIGLDIPLEGLFAEKFRRDMQLSGYRVIEYDTSSGEITKDEWEKLIKDK